MHGPHALAVPLQLDFRYMDSSPGASRNAAMQWLEADEGVLIRISYFIQAQI
jgi:hypothetical protein